MVRGRISLTVSLLGLCLLHIFFQSACTKQAPRPAYVLDEQKMTAVLTDMQIIEGVLNQKQYTTRSMFDFSQIYYDSLFVKYQIDKAMLDSSFAYYARQPAVFEKILSDVITALSKLEPKPVEAQPDQPTE